MYKKDSFSNRFKFVTHGFFYSAGVHVAEPSTILPLIISTFTQSDVIIGLFSSLLRGGAVIMQMFAAFYAQSYKRVINYLRFIFAFRFLAWFGIGYSISVYGQTNPNLTLWLMGICLFAFSFSAGFGTVYFQELMGKTFTNTYRGVTIAYRHVFIGIGGVLSILIITHFLKDIPEPMKFAYTFMISAGIMSFGYIFLGTVKEQEKQDVNKKEKSFIEFIVNSFRLIKEDKNLAIQILVRFISFTYLLALPFIIKHTKFEMSIGKLMVGSAVPLLLGTTMGNLIWVRIAKKGKSKAIVFLSIIFLLIALFIAFKPVNIFLVVVLYFFAGTGADGLKIAFTNLILSIAPDNKRPVYIAVQNNLTSFGLFFSIPGGALLSWLGYNVLLIITIVLMFISLILSFKLKEIEPEQFSTKVSPFKH